MAVEPLTPLVDAVHVLVRLVAVNTSVRNAFTFWMSAELVTDPLAPGDPSVWTVIAPEEKMVAGPKATAALPTCWVCGLFVASAASVTLGVGATGTPAGTPPKIVRFGTEYPEALPEIVVLPPAVVVVVRLPVVVVVRPVVVVVVPPAVVVVVPPASVVVVALPG